MPQNEDSFSSNASATPNQPPAAPILQGRSGGSTPRSVFLGEARNMNVNNDRPASPSDSVDDLGFDISICSDYDSSDSPEANDLPAQAAAPAQDPVPAFQAPQNEGFFCSPSAHSASKASSGSAPGIRT